MLYRNGLSGLKSLAFGDYSYRIQRAYQLPELYRRGQWTDTLASTLAILAIDPCSDIYRFAVQELLSEAAQRRDRPVFEEMLARAEEFQRRTGVPFGIVHQACRLIRDLEPEGDHLFHHLFILDNYRVWISPQHPWFPEVWERLGEGLGCAPVSRPYLWRRHIMNHRKKSWRLISTDHPFLTNLPIHYAALAGGWREQVKWFYEQGAYGQGWLEKRPGQIPKIQITDNLESQDVPRVCSNVLTAALYSNDFRVVRFVLDHFPQVHCRREMLFPLARCHPRLISRVLYLCPELWNIITLEDILRFHSLALLKAWLHRHPEGLPAGYHVPPKRRWYLFPCEVGIECYETALRLLSLLERHTADKDTRQQVRRQWFDMMRKGFAYLGWCSSGLICSRRLAAPMIPVGMDLTTLLHGQENKCARFRTLLILWNMLDEKNIPISHSLDLYSINRRMTRRCSHKLLQKIKPTRILPKPDPVTTELSRFLTLGEMEELGFITPVNLPYVRLSAKGPASRDMKYLAAKQQIARDRTITERYSFAEAGEEWEGASAGENTTKLTEEE